MFFFFFFQAEDGIRDLTVTGVQTCALPIFAAFVEGAARGSWPDYQLSALLMAVCVRGMSSAETADLTALMARSGRVLDLRSEERRVGKECRSRRSPEH